MKYFTTLLAYLLQIHRIPWLPANDFGREKRLGMAGIGALVLLFGGVMVYRMQNGAAENGQSAENNPAVALIGDNGKGATSNTARFSQPNNTFGATPSAAKPAVPSSTSNNERYPDWSKNTSANSTQQFGQKTPPAAVPQGNSIAQKSTPASNTSFPTNGNRYSQTTDDRYASNPTDNTANNSRYGTTPPQSGLNPSGLPTAALPPSSSPSTTSTMPVMVSDSPDAARYGNPLRSTSPASNTAPTTTLSGTVSPTTDTTASQFRNDPRVTPTSGAAVNPPFTNPSPTSSTPLTQTTPMNYPPLATNPPASTIPTTTPLAATPPIGSTYPPSSNGYGATDRYGRPTTATSTNTIPTATTPLATPNNLNGTNSPLVTTPTTVTTRDGRTIKVRGYKVREGDTLFDIARYELGKASRWAEIYQLNQPRLGDSLDYLAPGMELLLPDNTTAPQQSTEREPLTTSREFPTTR